MTLMDLEFYLSLLGVFAAAGIVFWFMESLQAQKQAKADAQFEHTMKMIELRDKKYEVKNESQKKT